MSNSLIKQGLTTYIPATPGDPGVPGTPGSPETAPTPGTPAYDEIRDYDQIEIVGYYLIPDPPPLTSSHLVPIYGLVHHHEVIHHAATPGTPGHAGVPGTPGTPPTPGTPAHTTVDPLLGWNAAAISQSTIAASGQLDFSIVAGSSGVVVGLNNANTGTTYTEILYGVYAEHNLYRIVESGVIKTGSAAYTTGGVFAISRLGSVVSYSLNGTIVYTSLTPSYGPLFADSSLYAAGDEIDNASIISIDTALAAVSGSLTEDLGAFTMRAADSSGYSALSMDFGSLGMHAEEYNDSTLAVDLGSFSMKATDGLANVLEMNVGEFGMDMESGFFAPVFNYVLTDIGDFAAYASGLTGSVGTLNQNLGAFDMKVANYAYTEVSMNVGNFGMYIRDSVDNNIVGVWPSMTAEILVDVLPTYYAQGITATIPKMTALVQTGGQIAATVPKMTAAVAVQVTTGVTITASPPSMTAVVAGFGGTLGTIAATVPSMTTVSYGGAFVSASMPKMTAVLAGLSGTAGSITASWPSMTADVEAKSGTVAVIVSSIPMMTANDGGFISATLPMMTALVIANDPVYAFGYAYAMTLNNETNPVTRYTNFNFKDIVRLGDTYLAYGPNGIYELTGTTDGTTPVPWSYTHGETSASKEGNSQTFNHRTEVAYLFGSFTHDVTLNVRVDESDLFSYTKTPPDSNLRTLRFEVGRGLLGHYWEYGLNGTGDFSLLRAEMLTSAQQRKVRYG